MAEPATASHPTGSAQAARGGSARTLRPRHQLFVQSRIVAAALTLPVFAAMLWFAIPRGTWPRVLVAMAVIAVVYFTAAYLLSRVRLVLEPDGLSENGFFSHDRRISAKRIASVVIVPVYRGESLETAPQLFMFDASCELLLRLRGQYWSSDDVQRVATAYGVPVRTVSEPLTRAQLREDYAPYLYWFERWPWVRVVCLVGGIAALSLLLIVLMSSTSLTH